MKKTKLQHKIQHQLYLRYGNSKANSFIKNINGIIKDHLNHAMVEFNDLKYNASKKLIGMYYTQAKQVECFESLWRYHQFVIHSPVLLYQTIFPVIPNYWNFYKKRRESVIKRLCKKLVEIDYDVINIKNIQKLEKAFKPKSHKIVKSKQKKHENSERILEKNGSPKNSLSKIFKKMTKMSFIGKHENKNTKSEKDWPFNSFYFYSKKENKLNSRNLLHKIQSRFKLTKPGKKKSNLFWLTQKNNVSKPPFKYFTNQETF